MPSDWRLTNQMNYLYRAVLRRKVFHKTKKCDHEHCEFCFGKFGEYEDALHDGYCTYDQYHWICDKCFEDFQKSFEWKVLDD